MTANAGQNTLGPDGRAGSALGSDFDRLVDQGAELPAPESLDDAAVTTKLWEVIGRLAGLGVFLINTDHLGDRQMYEQLWRELLREPPWERAGATLDGCTIVDLVATGDRAGVLAWLRYYADDDLRRDWEEEFDAGGGEGLPARASPPFDRDRYLPAPIFVKIAGQGP